MSQTLKHFTIPLFIPMQGCPFDCVFCNQRQITGQVHVLSDDEIGEKIMSHLKTMDKYDSTIEIGFFGGSFTGLPLEKQKHYLNLVQPWLKHSRIHGIRISTRPDYIHPEILEMLKLHGVKSIELGVQSMDKEVLKQSGRGYSTDDVRKSAAMIKNHGFSLGLQMMLGLPSDTFEKSLQTAKEIIRLGADATRIYPAVVVRNTMLENLFEQNQYKPLLLDQAISWCSRIVPLFENAAVKILRLGLHPSEGLLHGNDLIAGPFHVAFGEMVYSKIWQAQLAKIKPKADASVRIFVNPHQVNQAVGHCGENKKMLLLRFRKVAFKTDDGLKGREYYVDYH